MELQGYDLKQESYEIVIIPRGFDKRGNKIPDIVFLCGQVKDFDEFNALCPMPQAPMKIMAGGKRVTNTDDEDYQKGITSRATKRLQYMALKSLQATEGLKWSTVKMSDPSTWGNFEKELSEANFSDAEVQRIITGVFTANGLNQQRIDDAIANFQLGLEKGESDGGLSQPTEQSSTPSGEPASE